MVNFRENLKKVLIEGFSVNDLYAGTRYNSGVFKEIDPNDDTVDTNTDLNDPSADATPTDTKIDKPVDDADTTEKKPEDSSTDSDKDAPKKRPTPDEIEPVAPLKPIETPEQKVNRLYSDTGDVDADYSITSESNIRLSKFKFDNAGIKLDKILTEDDLANGISCKDVENRLTPAQAELYKEKNKELRKKYPLIDKREKMCLIHNARISMSKRNEKYEEIKIDNNQRSQAYEKLNSYMEEHFSKFWQDKTKYIDFLKTIKINFSDKPAIRSNLISTKKFINEDDENIIPLDKIYIQIPKSVQELILDNQEDPMFVKSNIFRTLNGAFNQEVAASNSLYVILNKENLKYGDESSTAGAESDGDSDDIDDAAPDEKPEDSDENSKPDETENSGSTSDEKEDSDSGLEPVGKDVEI